MIKSPLRYPGGKSKAIKQISQLIPDFNEFREPFVGGGSVFFYLKQKFAKMKFWINDLYFELYNFWTIAQNNMNDLLKQINTWRQEFSSGKDLHKFLRENISKFENIQKASAFFIFNRITFSGTTEAGGFSNQAFKARFTDSSIERLSAIEKILQNVTITNFDYQQVVEKEGDDVFIYLDPPYFSAMKSALYGKNGNLHKSFDHQRFAKIMKKCPHKWLITYDDSDYIKRIFSFANILNFDLTYGMRNQTETSNQKATELFISNYELKLHNLKSQALF